MKRSLCLSKISKNFKLLKYHVVHSILWLSQIRDTCLALVKANMASLELIDRKEKECFWFLKRYLPTRSLRTNKLSLIKTM